MSKRIISQGQIYICDLGNDIVGSEQSGERPCIVIQNNILNLTSEVIIVIPITSKKKKYLPTHYILTNTKYDFLEFKENTVLCECIRSISKKRMGKLVGQIDNEDLQNILVAKEYAYLNEYACNNTKKNIKERKVKRYGCSDGNSKK